MTLSEREKQVVVKVCGGHKRQAIADDLGISIKTVDVYLLRIRRKIGVASMLEIAVWFTRETFTPRSRE